MSYVDGCWWGIRYDKVEVPDGHESQTEGGWVASIALGNSVGMLSPGPIRAADDDA